MDWLRDEEAAQLARLDGEVPARRPYTTPRLRTLGTVADLTRMPKSLGVTEPPGRACTGKPSTC